MVKVLVKHSSKVFAELPEDVQKPTRLNRKEKFLNRLPKHFNRQKYLEVATALNIPNKTAEGYITDFCKSGLIHRESQDNYINTSIEDTQDSEDAKES
jgi:elongation factor P--beta-lysine ligase